MKQIKTTGSVVFRILLWLLLFIGGASVSVGRDLSHHDSLFFNAWFHIGTFVAGVLLMKLAFHAAAVGGRELAAHGREGELPRLETNRLVRAGIYRCTRHPMLFGLTLIPLSVALVLGSPTFMLFVAPAEMVFIVLMVIVFEEMECRRKFGEAYARYTKEVPLFPGNRECLKSLFLG